MAGNLYQLKTDAPSGANVVINGPYDRFGFVLARMGSGHHLIRGTGMEKPKGQLYNAETI